MVNPIVATARC